MNDVARPKDLRTQLDEYVPEFQAALPSNIPVEKFRRVVVTAINKDPALYRADRRSLFTACIRAAQDGLLPDGREAALVVFGKDVQYIRMVGGLYKMIHQSGGIRSINSDVVYVNDKFRFWVDDNGQHISHEPEIFGERGDPVGVYAHAISKEGGVYIEIASVSEIEKIRAVSRSDTTKSSSPWSKWWSEKAKVAITKRLAKRLPIWGVDLGAYEDEGPVSYEGRPRIEDYEEVSVTTQTEESMESNPAY